MDTELPTQRRIHLAELPQQDYTCLSMDSWHKEAGWSYKVDAAFARIAVLENTMKNKCPGLLCVTERYNLSQANQLLAVFTQKDS